MTYPAIIVDDEEINIRLIKSLIQNYCPEVNILSTATNVAGALREIELHKPQILFLDIQLNDKTGFDLLSLAQQPLMQVILVTAHAQYMHKAFKFGVTHYLLKPIGIEDLIAAVSRCKARLQTVPPLTTTQFLSVYQKGLVELIPFDDIIYLDAAKGYTNIFTTNHKKLLSTRTLVDTEAQLPVQSFMRVHHSHIVNTLHVRKYLRAGNGILILSDGTEIPISYAHKKEVSKRLGL